jgi:type VI secretion system protein ImpA
MEKSIFSRAQTLLQSSNSGLLGDLRGTEIRLGTSGKLSIGRIERILSGRVENEDYTRDQLLQILQSETSGNNSELLAIKQLLMQVTLLEKQFLLLFGNEQAPDFTQLKNLLANANPINNSIDITESESTSDYSINASELSAIEHPHCKVQSSQIKSRADAITMLDRVCEFLAKNDPSNPAPMLIKRARNMIGQDFFTILSQLAPDAIAQAEQVTGTQL